MSTQSAPVPAREQVTLRGPLLGTAIVGGLLTVGTLAGVGLREGLAAALGALVAVVNLWAIGKIVVALTTPDEETLAKADAAATKNDPSELPPAKTGRGVAWGGLAILKFAGIGVLLWLTLRNGAVNPLFLTLGFAALPIGVTASTIVARAKL